jgi:hypothetical protein
MDRLPPELVNTRRTVADLKVGETAYVSTRELGVDAERRCWIGLNATVHDEPALKWARFGIRRDSDGYHITIPRQQYTVVTPLPEEEVQAVSITLLD